MSDKSPPSCWLDKKLKELTPADKSSPENRKKLYGIWQKYKPSVKKKIEAECGKAGKKTGKKKK